MASRIQKLTKDGLINPPKWMPQNMHYETQMGSIVYGVSQDDSDVDVYGFCIPPKDMIFPHLAGEIPGFGNQIKRFEQYQQHHVLDKNSGKEYDFTVYSIVKYFQLCMENNPNMIDSLFVPDRCVLYQTKIAQMVREKRKMFLHKGANFKFRGYAYAQKSKIGTKETSANPKRQHDIDTYGYSLKYAYHLIRLLLQAEQILMEHDLDITRNRELLKSIRRGEWSLDRVMNYFDEKEKYLEELYIKSDLQNAPDEMSIKLLLMECLEEHYGSLSEAVKVQVPIDKLISELKTVLEKYEM